MDYKSKYELIKEKYEKLDGRFYRMKTALEIACITMAVVSFIMFMTSALNIALWKVAMEQLAEQETTTQELSK